MCRFLKRINLEKYRANLQRLILRLRIRVGWNCSGKINGCLSDSANSHVCGAKNHASSPGRSKGSWASRIIPLCIVWQTACAELRDLLKWFVIWHKVGQGLCASFFKKGRKSPWVFFKYIFPLFIPAHESPVNLEPHQTSMPRNFA